MSVVHVTTKSAGVVKVDLGVETSFAEALVALNAGGGLTGVQRPNGNTPERDNKQIHVVSADVVAVRVD